jgi:hypothetical protein
MVLGTVNEKGISYSDPSGRTPSSGRAPDLIGIDSRRNVCVALLPVPGARPIWSIPWVLVVPSNWMENSENGRGSRWGAVRVTVPAMMEPVV